MAPPSSPGPFIRPRILLAGALTGILALLFIADILSDHYQVSELTVTLLLGGILTSLGIEGIDFLRGGKK